MKPLSLERDGQLCILAVDDDSVNLLVVEQLLSQEGWKVVCAQDGDEALELLVTEDAWPDFIFLDYQMNVGDSGDEICRKLRRMFGPLEVPIVMCTAMGEGSEALESCKQAGATDVLLKPFERNKMIAKIQQHCGHKLAQHAQKQAPQPSAQHHPPPQSQIQQHQQQQQQQQQQQRQLQQQQQQQQQPLPAPGTAPIPRAAAKITDCKAVSPDAKPQNMVFQFCANLGLEYCGKKLASAGYSLDQLLEMDDLMLRKAGIVVQGQRDKILQERNKLLSIGSR